MMLNGGISNFDISPSDYITFMPGCFFRRSAITIALLCAVLWELYSSVIDGYCFMALTNCWNAGDASSSSVYFFYKGLPVLLLIPGGTTCKIANSLIYRLLAISILATILQSHYKSHYRNCIGWAWCLIPGILRDRGCLSHAPAAASMWRGGRGFCCSDGSDMKNLLGHVGERLGPVGEVSDLL